MERIYLYCETRKLPTKTLGVSIMVFIDDQGKFHLRNVEIFGKDHVQFNFHFDSFSQLEQFMEDEKLLDIIPDYDWLEIHNLYCHEKE